jgi:hypothetical protein
LTGTIMKKYSSTTNSKVVVLNINPTDLSVSTGSFGT